MEILLTALTIFACFGAALADHSKDIISLERVPLTRRLEGRVTLEYVDGNQRVKNKLAFTEVSDVATQRSKVSIGHVSYEPKSYYRRGDTILTVNSNGRCEKLPDGTGLLPELDFFLRYSYTDQELAEARTMTNSHSPLAILSMHAANINKFDHTETHRGIQCSVYRALYRRAKSDSEIKFDVFVPEITLADDAKMPIFTVRETVEGIAKADGLGRFSTILTIDFFYIEAIKRSDAHQMAVLEEELNLPFGQGCSEFLKTIVPSMPNFKSFMMSYVKATTNEFVSLAYDHEFGYLREEYHGQSVKVWDLNEDLLYHLDHSMYGRMQNADSQDVGLEPCSVLQFEDSKPPPPKGAESDEIDLSLSRQLERPYYNNGDSLDVLRFLGAQAIYYMGRSTIRDLPCLVFETILKEPPKIFQLDIQAAQSEIGTFEYIVQYFVFENGKRDLLQETPATDGSPPILMERFWPATMKLYVRHSAVDSAWIHLQETLDVQDFHWGLYGWQGKPSELFMLPECFNTEDEQLKIELSLGLKQLNQIKRQNILTRYKYKLEMDLQSHLFKQFQISRLHLTEYRLTLQKHSVLAYMVISDRKEDKKLSYFGEGELPSAEAFRDHKLQLTSQSATASVENCVMSGSHVSNIAMVIYCPGHSDDLRPSCLAIHDEPEPAVKRVARDKTAHNPFARPLCQAFRFEPSTSPKSATHDVARFHSLLDDHKFIFSLKDPNYINQPDDPDNRPGQVSQPESVEVVVEDFDVTREQQLVLINGYKFVLPGSGATKQDGDERPASNLRYFSSVSSETQGDCSRICNLDSSCRSYSYCTETAIDSNNDEPRCILTSLDLRKSEVEMQLVAAIPSKDQPITVKDKNAAARQGVPPNASEYKLILQSGCNLYGRDVLTMYTRTNEFLRINKAIANQFSIVASATDCAKRLLELEEKEETYHGSTFAYCAHTGTCLSDESMFGQMDGVAAASIADEEDPTKSPNEIACQLFRKRYQTYFHLSPKVVKRPDAQVAAESNQQEAAERSTLSGGIKQIELNLNTIEECAKACWTSFGHVCVSFDFCWPKQCTINAAGNLDGEDGSSSSSTYNPELVQYETRANCLGYTRDLKWDKLRRDHLLGRHKLLDVDTKPDNRSRGEWILNFLLLCAILVLFDIGLIIGRNFNDRWNNTTGIRRSILTESTGNLTQLFRTNRASTTSGTTRAAERMSSQSKFNIENEIYEDPNAIRLTDMGNSEQRTYEDINDVEIADSSERPNQEAVGNLLHEDEPVVKPRPTGNYIDVPDLL